MSDVTRDSLLSEKFSLYETHLQQVADAPQHNVAVCFDVAAEALPADLKAAPAYADGGKRFEFALKDGAVQEPGTGQPFSPQFDSDLETKHATTTDAPQFSMVVASGGRVFAKEKGRFSFWFATLQHPDLYFDAKKESFQPVRNAHFSLDPDHNRASAPTSWLTLPMKRNYGRHPAAERFGLIADVIEGAGGLGFQVVFMEPRVWQWLDTRPPAEALDLSPDTDDTPWWQKLVAVDARLHALSTVAGALKLPHVDLRKVGEAARKVFKAVKEKGAGELLIPSLPLASHPVARYRRQHWTLKQSGTTTRKVLEHRELHTHELAVESVQSIGVGHVHLHEHYDRRYGGEVQPLQADSPFAQNEKLYSLSYRFLNGPIRDFDGFVDGTCNFYVLCRLKQEGGGSRYGVLWTDEQTYFAQRWRLLHPSADTAGLQFALTADIQGTPALYNFDQQAWWDPLDTGHVSDQSRMAVARQVVLVTGKAPKGGPEELYSINFSWASMDRTWRHRRYPEGAVVHYDGPVEVDAAEPDRIYPQTIRLREDLTIAIQGTRGGVAGWWFQKYLPADNQHRPRFVQAPPAGKSARPKEGYSHPWDFLPQAAFEKADQTLHFGVFAPVHSRCQYYTLEISPADAQLVREVGEEGACWEAAPGALYINTARMNWHAPRKNGVLDVKQLVQTEDPLPWTRTQPNLYGSPHGDHARLKLLDRGPLGFIAVQWDKRDDSLLPFSDLPRQVRLTCLRKGKTPVVVDMVLGKNVSVVDPPMVQRAELSVAGKKATLTVTTNVAPYQQAENLWKARVGCASRPDLQSIPWSDFTRQADGTYAFTWSVDAATAKLLSQAGRDTEATHVWFEDVVGHVAGAEELELPPA